MYNFEEEFTAEYAERFKISSTTSAISAFKIHGVENEEE
jgi:hypothetical protein